MSSAAIEWMVLVGGGEPEEVITVDAFTQVRRNSPGTASPRLEWDAAVARSRAELGEARCEDLQLRGRSLTMGEAIERARRCAASGVPD